MLNVIARTGPMRSASRPKRIPPTPPAIRAEVATRPILALLRPNSRWIGRNAYVKSRKSIASSIQPSCAANRARQAGRPTVVMDILGIVRDVETKTAGHEARRSSNCDDYPRRLEGDLRAEPPDTRRLELGDTARSARIEAGVTLKDRAVVRGVEEIGRERDSKAVEDAEVLGCPEVDLVHVVEPAAANRLEQDVVAGREVRIQVGRRDPERLGITLTSGHAGADVEVPRQLIEAGHV